MKDLYNHLVPVQAVVPVKVLDATVPTTVEIDLAKFNAALIVISCGAKAAGDTGTIDVTLTHADDDGTGAAGAYAAAAAADVLGVTPTAGVILNLAAGAVAAAVYRIGYVGGKRFIKAAVTETGSNATGTMMSITVIKGHGSDVPAIA
ncbi:MAG: hypothetical protein V2A54_10030 [Bacteroidota bacterium]